MPSTKPYARPAIAGLLLACTLLARTSRPSDVIVVKSGKLHHFAVSGPANAVAGTAYTLTVEAFDAQGNRVTDAAKIPGAYTVAPSGAAKASPASLAADAFKDGIAKVAIAATRAEPVVVAFTAPDGTTIGQSKETRIAPGPLERFVVQAPSIIQAGVAAAISAEAQDAYGNVVRELASLGRELTVTSDGAGLFEPGSVPISAFEDGRASFRVAYKVAESVRLTLGAPGLNKRGSSGAIAVKPGPPEYVQILPPATVTAGKAFTVTLRVFDAFNNRVSDYGRVGGDVSLGKTGQGTLEPRLVEVGRFQDAEARIQATVTIAESFRLTATMRDKSFSSEVVQVEPGDVALVEVEAPPTARVYERFALRLTLKDAHGNLVAKPTQAERTLALRTGEGAASSTSVALKAFSNGVALVELALTKVGPATVTVALGERQVGVSPTLDVLAGDAASFVVEAPSSLRAGEPFEVAITALDAHGNVARDYDKRGVEITVSSEGDGPLLLPYRVLPSKFSDGRAWVTPVLEKTGSLRIRVQGPKGEVLGRSEAVKVLTSQPDHVLVSAPQTATAGDPFEVTLEARDRFGNLVTDYDALGLDVRLESDGQGRIDPSIVPAARFKSGIATVAVTYDRAEAFALSAGFAATPKSAEASDNHRYVPRLERAKPSPEAPRREGLPTPAPAVHAEPLPTPTPTPPPVRMPTSSPTPPPVRLPTPAPTPQASSAPVLRPTPPPTASPKPTPPPIPAASVATPATTIIPTPATEEGFRISQATYSEQGAKGTLELTTNGLVSAEVSTQLRYGTEWIQVDITPVLNDPAGLLQGFHSKIFGELQVRLVGRTATIALELVAPRIDYNTSRRADGVTVTFTRLGPEPMPRPVARRPGPAPGSPSVNEERELRAKLRADPDHADTRTRLAAYFAARDRPAEAAREYFRIAGAARARGDEAAVAAAVMEVLRLDPAHLVLFTETPPRRRRKASGDAPHIVVAHDEEAVRTTLVRVLEAWGHRVSGVATAAELATLTSPPDLLIVGPRLPDLSGFELAQAVRERQPRVAVIMLTAAFRGAAVLGRSELPEGVVDEYVERPFTSASFEEKVTNCLWRAAHAAAIPPSPSVDTPAPSASSASETGVSHNAPSLLAANAPPLTPPVRGGSPATTAALVVFVGIGLMTGADLVLSRVAATPDPPPQARLLLPTPTPADPVALWRSLSRSDANAAAQVQATLLSPELVRSRAYHAALKAGDDADQAAASARAALAVYDFEQHIYVALGFQDFSGSGLDPASIYSGLHLAAAGIAAVPAQYPPAVFAPRLVRESSDGGERVRLLSFEAAFAREPLRAARIARLEVAAPPPALALSLPLGALSLGEDRPR